MMGTLKDEWNTLFLQTITALAVAGIKLDGETICIVGYIITIGTLTLHSGTKPIINDILIWSNNIPAILIYFKCVCKVFQKYLVSFRLDKYKFLENRVEFVGHDLTPDGNYPAASKVDLITDWKLPLASQSLHSFVGMVIFYHKYAPYLEMRIKPLRKLIKDYFRKPILLIAWSPDIISLLHDIKLCITTSTVLARFDSAKIFF